MSNQASLAAQCTKARKFIFYRLGSGGITGPVGPEEAENLAWRYREADGVHGHLVAETLGEHLAGDDTPLYPELYRRLVIERLNDWLDWFKALH